MRFPRYLLVLLVLLAWSVLNLGDPSQVRAEEKWKQSYEGVKPGTWYLGVRAGFTPLTQELARNTDTDVGSLLNFQAMYAVNKWLFLGMMIEWERHSVDTERPSLNLGHLDTVSVLPTLELRPFRVGPISPYANMSFGVNVNGFGEDRDNIGNTTISPSNNFAWRLGWGADYALTEQLALNVEMAYKRNDGHVTIGNVRSDDWNASSFGFLVGVRLFFF